MSEQLNEMPVLKVNQDYIDRLEKRSIKLRDRLHSYRWRWDEEVYRHRTTNRKMSKEKYDELQKQYNEANRKVYDIANRERSKIADTAFNYAAAFLVMDKRQNPSLYPEWLSFSFPDSKNQDRRGYHEVIPYIDLEKALQTNDNWNRVVNRATDRLNQFFKRYFPNEANINISSATISGIDDYIKKVFKKEIRKRIKDIDTRNCIHSIVFRVRSRYTKEVQIYPRWRDNYPCYSWNTQGEIEREMKNILREYGWVEGRNYTDSKQRD